MNRVSAALAALTLSACATIPKAPACPSATEATTAVPETLRRMYAALTVENEAAFRAELADGFYAYDVGKRFSADELFLLIKAAHAAGKRFVWTVQEPDTHVTCDLAWVAYVNRGSVTDGTGERLVAWLESAAVVHERGAWRIRFFHSTRVPPAP